MPISSDYPRPVIVNGFSCKNCAEFDEAKKFIDPRHPRSGPFGDDARSDPTVNSSPAVQLGGRLARDQDGDATNVALIPPARTSGSALDIRV